MALLKLRYCTFPFTKRFPPWSLPRVGSQIGKRYLVSSDHLPVAGGDVGKRVRLTKKTRPGISFHVSPDPVLGALNAEAMEKIAPPFLRRSGG